MSHEPKKPRSVIRYSDIRKHFEKFFDELFQERNNFDELSFIEDEDGYTISAVIDHERKSIFAEINKIREKNNLPVVTKQQVDEADRLATGHVDFASKLITYCTELTIDGKLDPSSYW